MTDWFAAPEAALNAVFGDYLEERRNPLAIEMQFYDRGRALELTPEALRAAHPRLSPRVVVLVHGMALTESCWAFTEGAAAASAPSVSAPCYGSLLRDEFGVTPFYVRYNTGRHVSQNGRALALLLERLFVVYPSAIEELDLIGHSMGGLVLRSACHYAEELGHGWLACAKRAFYLGSPHLGSPYERVGHVLSVVLRSIDHPVVQLTGTLGNLRSAGVKDLRNGSLLDEDWKGLDLDAPGKRRPRRVPLRPSMAHYLIAGSLTKSENHLLSRLIGDALVRLPSATAPGRKAALPAEHFALLPGVNHMQLARCPQVYAVLRKVYGEPRVAQVVTEPQDSADPERLPSRSAKLQRLEGYRALLQDAVHHGATAIQQVQEELARRPYAVLEQIPPLERPARLVRSAHFSATRGVYGTIRAINATAGAALRGGIDWLGRMR
jgi:pimeloyl-ACP methyl ester carboxylesterase